MRATDEHRTAYLTAQMMEASNDVQESISRLMAPPEDTLTGVLDYCGRATAASRALLRLADATLAVTGDALSDLEEATRA